VLPEVEKCVSLVVVHRFFTRSNLKHRKIHQTFQDQQTKIGAEEQRAETMAVATGETFQERAKGKDVRTSNIVAAKVSDFS
jgi:hypothetical protein